MKLTERLDIPGCVRHDVSLRAKLNVVKRLRRRNLAQQVREAITRGVDQEFAELGKEAIEMFCREMSASSPATSGASPVSVNVGRRRELSEEKAS